MGLDNVNQTDKCNTSNRNGLSLCDLSAVGKTIEDDFRNYGPGFFKGAQDLIKRHPDEAKLAAVGGALVAVSIASECPFVIGTAGSTGLLCIGGAIAKVAAEESKNLEIHLF